MKKHVQRSVSAFLAAAVLALNLPGRPAAAVPAPPEAEPADTPTEQADTWEEIQDAFSGGYSVQLTADITAEIDNTVLLVPDDTEVTLDLNGYRLDRALSEAKVNGSVIIVKEDAALTVTDTRGGGRITGGKQKNEYGGGIVNHGTLTLEGGTIADNTADQGGGGIYNTGSLTISDCAISGNKTERSGTNGGGILNETGAELCMKGGTITDNSASFGGGIANKGRLTLENGEITGNQAAANGGGIYLDDAAELTEITGGKVKDNTAAAGRSIQNVYLKSVNLITVSKTPAEGTEIGVTISRTVKPEQNEPITATLPEGVTLGTAFFSDNPRYELVEQDQTAFLSLKIILHDWEGLQNAFRRGGSYQLEQDITAGIGNTSLTVPENTNVVLDLNGFVIDRACKTKDDENGNLVQISAGSSLHITDSVKTGKLTGAYGNQGCIYVGEGGTFILSGGFITNNRAENGSAVYNDGGTVTISGGAITNNKATQTGAVYMTAGKVNLEGGSITQNSAAGISAVYASGGSVVISGTSITKNTSKTTAAVFCTADADLLISGGKIQGNLRASGAEKYNCNLYVESAHPLKLDSTLSSKTSIGITTDTEILPDVPVPFTEALSSAETAGLFFADEVGCEVVVQNGFACIAIAENLETWRGLQNALIKGGVIVLTNNLAAAGNDVHLTVPAGKTVLLDLCGFSIDRALTEENEKTDCILYIEEGADVTITDSDRSGIGSLLHGYDPNETGGIINHGKLTLLGGTVSDVTGNGLYNSGECTINGGKIMKCTGNGAENHGTMTLESGTISQNGKYGICNVNGERRILTINDGIISEQDNAYAVYNGSTMTFNGGTIQSSQGGILNYGVCDFNGGTISQCTAYALNNQRTLRMAGGVITENTGDACVMNASTFTMTGGSIEKNSPTGHTGCVFTSGSFTLKDGKIADNEGSGLYIYNIGSLLLEGGEITGNRAETGAGIYAEGTVTVKGGRVTGNTLSDGITPCNVCIVGKPLQLSNSVSADALIGISVLNPPIADERIPVAKISANNDVSGILYPDRSEYALIPDGNMLYLTLGRIPLDLRLSIGNWYYGEEPYEPLLSGNTGNGHVTFEYAVSGTDDYNPEKPVNAGHYTVRATVAETAVYAAGTVSCEFEIRPADASAARIQLEEEQYFYTGSVIRPKLTVTYCGEDLTAGTDYIVTYTDNITPGTAHITVTFRGNYTGAAYAWFTITEAPELVIPGDLDRSGALTVADAVLLARVLAEDSTAETEQSVPFSAALLDINGDGLVTLTDLNALIQLLRS